MRNCNEKYMKKKANKVLSLDNLYDIWYDRLTSMVIRIFEYKGLPFAQHELEKRNIIMGYAPLCNDKKIGFMTSFGSQHGVTEYYDKYTKFTYAAPTAKGGTLNIGSDVVICKANSLMIPIVDTIEKYALLLSHSDLTIKCGLINSRENRAFVAHNQQEKDDLDRYNSNVEMGKPYTILSNRLLGEETTIENPLVSYRYNFDLESAVIGQNEILRSFYREIGITWVKEKRGNMTETEVVNDRQLLLFNIDDMLKCRQEFCEMANKVFGLNISVKLAKPFEYLLEEGEDGERYDGDN